VVILVADVLCLGCQGGILIIGLFLGILPNHESPLGLTHSVLPELPGPDRALKVRIPESR